MQRGKVIIFDLGGVLVEHTGWEALTQLLPVDAEARNVVERWNASSAVRRFERGEIAPSEFAALFVREWKLSLQPSEFITRFATWPKGFFPGVSELLEELRRRHCVVCLSNSNEIHWATLPRLDTLFHFAFSSHQIGCTKPDPEAFDHVLRALAARAEDAYFFDDLRCNVEAARALGISAYQVEGFSHAKAILRDEMLV